MIRFSGKNIPGSPRIQLPASKSIANRIMLLAFLRGTYFEAPLSESLDSVRMHQLLMSLEQQEELNVHDSGTVCRFMLAFLAAKGKGDYRLVGNERMHERPIGQLVDSLRSLDASISYEQNEGFLPLHITSRQLEGGKLILEKQLSSQFVSAILMIAPLCQSGLELQLASTVRELPYVYMTTELMKRGGYDISVNKNSVVVGSGISKPIIDPIAWKALLEPDWSAAIYFLLLSDLHNLSSLRINDLDSRSLQGDSQLGTLFGKLGLSLRFHEQGAGVDRHAPTGSKIRIDLTRQPDLAQPICFYCIAKEIPFKLSGLESLAIKETNRISAMREEAAKLQVHLVEEDDSLSWDGKGADLNASPVFNTYNDHRMAMSLALLASVMPNAWIDDPDVCAKSFPHFWKELEVAGFKFERK